MTAYQNPFFTRASEQLRDAFRFIQTFGSGALDLLPERAWDRLVLLRSSPGFGKTSLMRLFTVDSLEQARQLPPSESLARELRDRNVLREDGTILKMGILLGLDRDYLSLLDLDPDPLASDRLLFRLLDARIVLATLRAALRLGGRSYPGDLDLIEVRLTDDDPSLVAALERLGGPTGPGLDRYSRASEQSILDLLDAVTTTGNLSAHGHRELLSLSVLSACDIYVGGHRIDAQPLVMLDDGQALHRRQREMLLKALASRRLTVARWYAERYEALSDQELLGEVGTDGRDLEVLDLEQIAREGSADGRRFNKGRYERVLADIARRRAASALDLYAHESRDFFALLEEERSQLLGEDADQIVNELRRRAVDASGGDQIYDRWIEDAAGYVGYDAAIRWQELFILMSRNRDRQLDVFATQLSLEESKSRSNASIREAASLRTAQEFGLPYYGGPEMVAKLGSNNAEQFLDICGDMFAEMLIDITVGRVPRLALDRQDKVIRSASRRFWQQIPERVPFGRDVQALVLQIVRMAAGENQKPTLPYPPGVTGTALLMSERQLLLDPDYRARQPGSDRLFRALASAVSRNVLSAQLNYSVKNNSYMVLYLNRLLCPYFGLPLGFGSFRERRLAVMSEWLSDGSPPASEQRALL